MYDLKKAVGPSKMNLPDDCKLLSSLFAVSQQSGDPGMQGIPMVAITPTFTPALAQAIVKYQKNIRDMGGKIVQDGIVDPLPSRSGTEGDWDRTYKSGADSTLGMLCYRLFRMNQPGYFKLGDTLKLPWVPDPYTDMS